MTKLKLLASAAAAIVACTISGAASAATYILAYSGIAAETSTPFATTLNLDLSASGAVATFISGTRNGVAITGLSTYAAADNKLSFTTPYVSFGGLSFTLTGGTQYNFAYDSGNYYELNSVSNPTGVSSGVLSRVLFASVNGVPITPTVPEPATWAMMLVGFGAVAGVSRYRRRNTTTVYA